MVQFSQFACCRILGLGWLSLQLVAGCGRDDAGTYRAAVDAWHQERIERLQSDTGWLTLVGLHPLLPGEHTVGTAAENEIVLRAEGPGRVGMISLVAEDVAFIPAPGVKIMRIRADSVQDTSFGGGRILADIGDGPDVLSTGSLVFYVVHRGSAFFLRVKDKQAAVRRHFQGVDRYPVDRAWRVAARLEGPAGMIEVVNVLGQTANEESPGRLIFTLQGESCHLVATKASHGRLFVVFGDETNGQGTYPGGRFLVIDPPDDQGRFVLDFNRAINPPCSFTPYATCPLPGPDNRLPVAVRSGEKQWGDGHAGH